MYMFHPIISDWIIEDIQRDRQAAVAKELQMRLLKQSEHRTSPFRMVQRWLTRRNEVAPTPTLCCGDYA